MSKHLSRHINFIKAHNLLGHIVAGHFLAGHFLEGHFLTRVSSLPGHEPSNHKPRP
jgi:hypothetical protein